MTPRLATAVLLLCSGIAQAQPGAGPMHGRPMNSDNTPGWSMMTPAERQAHHDKMMTMTDHAACSAHMQEHHAQMTARAKERGRPAPALPRHDACAPLKKK